MCVLVGQRNEVEEQKKKVFNGQEAVHVTKEWNTDFLGHTLIVRLCLNSRMRNQHDFNL